MRMHNLKKANYQIENHVISFKNNLGKLTKTFIPIPENSAGSLQLTLTSVGSSRPVTCSQMVTREFGFGFWEQEITTKNQARSL